MTTIPSRCGTWIIAHKIWFAIGFALCEISGGIVGGLIVADHLRDNQVKLCTAAAGLAEFWKGVRASTMRELSDRFLVESARRADREFVVELTAVIAKAEAASKC